MCESFVPCFCVLSPPPPSLHPFGGPAKQPPATEDGSGYTHSSPLLYLYECLSAVLQSVFLVRWRETGGFFFLQNISPSSSILFRLFFPSQTKTVECVRIVVVEWRIILFSPFYSLQLFSPYRVTYHNCLKCKLKRKKIQIYCLYVQSHWCTFTRETIFMVRKSQSWNCKRKKEKGRIEKPW